MEGLALALREHAGTPAPWQAKFEAAAAVVCSVVRPSSMAVATLLTCDQSGMRLGEGEKARKTKKWNIHDQNNAAGRDFML